MLIKNNTPYVGKIKLAFQDDLHHTPLGKYSVFNKIHMDLGFTKLISRVYPKKLDNGYHKLNSEKIKTILEKTKGKIGVHEWWLCTSKNTGYNKTMYKKPNPATWEIMDHNILEESFVSQNNEYVGDVQDAWWYVQNNLQVCEEFPYGVAKEVGENDEITGYYGYTHRGGALFQKGDRLFDENYIPIKEDYPYWQWAGWKNEWDELYENSNIDDKRELDDDGIKSIIPFNQRGKITIETWDQAKQAAYNLSKYL